MSGNSPQLYGIRGKDIPSISGVNNPKIRCTNCNQYGHHIRNCYQPVSSYGLIAFRVADPAWTGGLEPIPMNKVEFLMIQRRNTYGFVEIIRGKYKINDVDYLRAIISETTAAEQEDLLLHDFDTLWRNMWGQENKNYKHDFEVSKEKFHKISVGVEDPVKKEKYTLAQLICENKTKWKTAEWGFPKGKPNLNESAVETAEREFCEETGLHSGQFHIFENLHPFQENFCGTNNINYKLIYYLAYIPYNVTVKIKKDDEVMMREIGDIGWVSYEDALRKIRFYNNEKKDLIVQVYNTIKNYMPLLIGPINPASANANAGAGASAGANANASTSVSAGTSVSGSSAKTETVNDETHNRGHYESADEKRNNHINGRTYAEVAADNTEHYDSCF